MLMYSAIALLVALIALFLVPVVVFKANSAILFLSACAGLVILNSLEPSIVTTAGSIIPFEGESVFRLLVILLPVVFASLVFHGTIKATAMMLHILLSMVSGFCLWVILPKLVSINFVSELTNYEPWQDAVEFTALGLSVALLLSLTILSITKNARHDKKHH